MMTGKEINKLNDTVLEILDIFPKLSAEDQQKYIENVQIAEKNEITLTISENSPETQ